VTAAGGRRSRRLRAILLAASLAAVGLAAWNLAVPGLYYDETLFCNAALGGPTDGFVALRWQGVPILLMQYIGALKAWLYYPLFRLAPVNPWTVRLPAILAGVAGGCLLVAACGRLAGWRAALFALPLVLFDPALLMHSRLDWGPTALMFLFRGLALFGIADWWRRGTPGGLWLFVAAAALGLFDKLNFLWVFAAAPVAMVAAAPQKCRGYAERHPGACAGQALAIVGLLATGLWRARQIVRAGGIEPAGQSWSYRLHVAWNLLEHTLVGDGPLRVVGGDGVEPARWMLPAYGVAAAVAFIGLVLGWRLRRLRRRAWLFTVVFTLLVAAAFAATKSATGPHHAAVIAGLPGLVLAPLLAACLPRRGRAVESASAVAALAATAILAGSMLVTSLASIRAFERPGNRAWDPAHNRLAEFADAHPCALFRTADWGLGNQLLGLTEGQATVNDNWPEFTSPASARRALLGRPADRELYIVAYAPGEEIFPAGWRGLAAELESLRLVPEEVAVLPAIEGRPLIRILKIPRPAAAESAPAPAG
jgi:hypothetical protein